MDLSLFYYDEYIMSRIWKWLDYAFFFLADKVR